MLRGMHAVRIQLTLPSIDLPTAQAMAPELREWMLEAGLTKRGKGLDGFFSDKNGRPAVGQPWGPAAQPYLRHKVETAPVCVLDTWRFYPIYWGEDVPVSACSVCGSGSPDEDTMISMGIYERWLREQQVPEVLCENCGHSELLTDRYLDDVDIVAPLAITSASFEFLNHVLDELPDRFRPEEWCISVTKV
jgi:hypothetical protein